MGERLVVALVGAVYGIVSYYLILYGFTYRPAWYVAVITCLLTFMCIYFEVRWD